MESYGDVCGDCFEAYKLMTAVWGMDHNFEILSLLDNSIEFEKLHSKFNRFNPFKILKVDKFEIRHSNMIAWLLDPTENHHLGSMFVNKLLSKTFVKAENEELIGQYNFIKLHK